ncbi:MAG: hypothetical protein ACRC2T_02650 [Thermoguttaceae bacterium]
MMQIQIENKHSEDKTRWWQFDSTTWILIAGLVIINVAFFIDISAVLSYIATIGKILDVRLWPRWYLPIVMIIVVCAVKWLWNYLSWKNDDLDDYNAEKSWAFFVMSATLSLEAIILIVLHATKILKFLFLHLWMWFYIGSYSYAAVLCFLLICAFIMVAIYVVRCWAVVVLRPD